MKPMSYYPPNSNLPSRVNDLVGLGDDNVVYQRITNNDATSKARKRIRRSRYDQEGRTYICTCGKSYLSYAALYWHIKVKHNGVDPQTQQPLPNKKQQQQQNSCMVTNSQGEPAQIVVAGSKKVMKQSKLLSNQSGISNESSYLFLSENIDAYSNNQQFDSNDKANRDLLERMGGTGGPTHPLTGIDIRIAFDVTEQQDQDEKGPSSLTLKRAIQHFIQQNSASSGYQKSHPSKRKNDGKDSKGSAGLHHNEKGKKSKKNYKNSVKQEQTSNLTTCGSNSNISTLDKVMAQFLIQFSQISADWFYKLLVCFVKIYHTCVLLFKQDCHNRVAMESVPQIGTMYLINKMKDMSTIYDIPLAIVLNMHFIGWLRRNKKSVGIDVIPAAKSLN